MPVRGRAALYKGLIYILGGPGLGLDPREKSGLVSSLLIAAPPNCRGYSLRHLGDLAMRQKQVGNSPEISIPCNSGETLKVFYNF